MKSPFKSFFFKELENIQLVFFIFWYFVWYCYFWYLVGVTRCVNYRNFTYLIGKKKVGVKKSRQKIWSVKKLVTCPKFSHFLQPNFLF